MSVEKKRIRKGVIELIKKFLQEELKDTQTSKLAIEILEAYLKDGKKGIDKVIKKRFQEVVKNAG